MMRQTTRTSPHRSAPREPHRTSPLITKLFDRHKPFQRNGASIASRSNSRHRTRQAGRANPPSTQNQATPLVLTKTKPGPHPSPRLRYGPFFTSWTTDAIKKKKNRETTPGAFQVLQRSVRKATPKIKLYGKHHLVTGFTRVFVGVSTILVISGRCQRHSWWGNSGGTGRG